MFTLLLSAIFSIRSWFRSRAALQVEILALRHQLTVLKRSQRGRLRLNSADRLLWVGLSRLWSQWRSALLIVRPETAIAWHRRGLRWYWRWKSRQSEPGRPAIDTRKVTDPARHRLDASPIVPLADQYPLALRPHGRQLNICRKWSDRLRPHELPRAPVSRPVRSFPGMEGPGRSADRVADGVL